MNTDDPIRVGVSACLLGQQVRFDGGHKRSAFLTDTLARFVELIPVCPEVEFGMGIPRETIRLERAGETGIRLVAPKSGTDHTEAMQAWSTQRVAALEPLDLCGYVLKKDSPSCGMERVKVHPPEGGPSKKDGVGVYAQALMARYPLLPVEEEGRLEDARLRENFIERLFAYRRLRGLFQPRWTVGDLVRFHTAEKLLLLAHEPEGYRALGRVVAAAKGRPRAELAEEYRTTFMRALAKHATTRKHVNVLQHMQGYFRKLLPDPQRRELEQVIHDYRRELIPLIVPITLFRHQVRVHGVSYLEGQTYLEPHPKELMARNHV